MKVHLHHTISGPEEAPVLVLGSSLGTTGAMWQPQMTALTETFRVVRYDHRGHGSSPMPPGPYSIEDLGGDLLTLLDDLELEQAYVAGISLGGMVAMWAAAHAPQRFSRLALLCTSAKLGPPSAWAQRIATVNAGGVSAVADGVVGRWFTPGFAQRHGAVVGWARSMLIASPAQGYVACCAAIQHMDLEAMLGAITAPTLVVAADQDQSTPVEQGERIAAAIPGARLEIVADAAHLASIQQPEAVSALLKDFYDS